MATANLTAQIAEFVVKHMGGVAANWLPDEVNADTFPSSATVILATEVDQEEEEPKKEKE